MSGRKSKKHATIDWQIQEVVDLGFEVKQLARQPRHCRVGAIDWWPGTGTWIDKAANHRGKGTPSLIAQLKAPLIVEKPKPEQPALPIQRRRVSLFADASFKEKFGGYGVWIKGDGMPIAMTFGGSLKYPVADSTDAELRSIVRGLQDGIRANIIHKGDEVWIQCDNVGALAAVMLRCGATQSRHADGAYIPTPKRLTKSLQTSPCVPALIEIKKVYDLKFVVRHVKGHRDGEGRQWVNRQVDRLAKEGRRMAELEARIGVTA